MFGRSLLQIRRKPFPSVLWLVPAGILACSYLYIGWYHQTWLPVFRIVHEGGKLTLWETALYASHFLGHLPVLVTLALWSSGNWISLSGNNVASARAWPAVAALLLFLLVTTVLSLGLFGATDTLDFVLQRKQSEAVHAEGGSWNLHLPSTMLLFFVIPGYCAAVRRFVGLPVVRTSRGRRWLVVGWALTLAVTAIINPSPLEALARIWSSPRYLAHSVRELLTLPLICFPPAFLLLTREESPGGSENGSPVFWTGLELAGLVAFLVGAAVQSLVSLDAGVSNLAQKPSFAHAGKLSIPYLLSVHYFEHLLDAVFLALACVVLVRLWRGTWVARATLGL